MQRSAVRTQEGVRARGGDGRVVLLQRACEITDLQKPLRRSAQRFRALTLGRRPLGRTGNEKHHDGAETPCPRSELKRFQHSAHRSPDLTRWPPSECG